MTDNNSSRNIFAAAVFFSLATIITWRFIVEGAGLYHFDTSKMILSCAIAGAKWGLQILAAVIFLKQKRWLFIRRIGFTCFAGSCLLVPFCFGYSPEIFGVSGFAIALIAAVASMLVLYYRSVRQCEISVNWYLFWLLCLAIAVSLQLTVVFHVI